MVYTIVYTIDYYTMVQYYSRMVYYYYAYRYTIDYYTMAYIYYTMVYT